MQTPLGKVRGLGSAGNGTHHFWMQRLTAIALVPLTVWFLVSVVALIGADHPTVVAWIANPFAATLMILFLATLFYHLKLGAQVIIEDYIHGEAMKLASQITVSFACAIIGLASILAVLKIFVNG